MAQLAAWCISKVMWCKHKWKTLVSGCVRCWLNHILLFPGTPHSDRALTGYLPEDIRGSTLVMLLCRFPRCIGVVNAYVHMYVGAGYFVFA